MIKHSHSISISVIFIYINSLVWLAFGLIIAFDAHPAIPEIPFLKAGMAFLAIVTAGSLFVLGILISKRNRIAFKLTLGLLIITSLLSIFDDFGMIDLAFLIINLIPLALLIKEKRWYLQSNPQTQDGSPQEI